MRVVLTILLAVLLCGCGSTPWMRGEIADGLPRRVEKFPPATVFHVMKTEKRVKSAFEEALRARGFHVTGKEEACEVIVRVKVDVWEYNDIGFGGKQGARDDMELSVTLVDRAEKRILARARISLRSDFRIIQKYVEGL